MIELIISGPHMSKHLVILISCSFIKFRDHSLVIEREIYSYYFNQMNINSRLVTYYRQSITITFANFQSGTVTITFAKFQSITTLASITFVTFYYN